MLKYKMLVHKGSMTTQYWSSGAPKKYDHFIDKYEEQLM